MKRRRRLYCWLRGPGQWCLGRNPPDSPVSPYSVFHSMDEVERVAEGWKADVVWCGEALAMRQQIGIHRGIPSDTSHV